MVSADQASGQDGRTESRLRDVRGILHGNEREIWVCHSAQLLAPYILFFKLSELLMIRGCPTLTWSGTILEDTSLLGGVMIIRET